jgi:hypothetical protein
MKFKTLILLLLLPLYIFAQTQKDKITLTTGEVYMGKIVFENETMIVLRTDDGARFQFQLSQISKKEVVEESTELPKNTKTEAYSSNFRLMPSVQIGINNAKYKFDLAVSTEVSLAMGINNFSGKNWFLGGGLGMFSIFDPTSNATENFLPLFVRTQANFGNKQNAMFWGIDAGYHFALNNNYKGGLFSKVSLGYCHKITERSNLLFSVSAAIRNVETQLTETRNNTNYLYTGNTNIAGLALNLGIMF